MTTGLRSRLKSIFDQSTDRPLVVYRNKTVTYGAALTQISALHKQFSDIVELGGRIGVMSERGPSAYVGTLAAFMTGRTYVTLSPKMPAHRLRQIAQSADLCAVLLSTSQIPLFQRVFSGSEHPVTGIIIDECPDPGSNPDMGTNRLVVAGEPADPASLWEDGCEDPDVAYLLFTSGSTGNPKGVPVSTKSLCSYIDSVTDFYGFSSDDRHSQTFDLSFDLAMHDLLVATSTGGALVPFLDADLLSASHHAETHDVTCWFSVPSQAALMSKARTLTPGSMKSVRLSLFCGEPLSCDLAKKWQAAAPNSIIENLYGPTEATIAMSRYRFHPQQDNDEARRGLVPIGSPFPGMKVRFDTAPSPAPDDIKIAGELMLAGRQLATGYWKSDSQTARSFVTLDGEPETVWYRTGDIVEQSPSGCLHFVGRTDQQIKIAGHRLEIGEVETELRRVSGSPASAVVPWPVEGTSIKGLVGFVEGASIGGSQIRKLLRERLPEYMIPKKIYTFDELPRSTSGKIDRRRLTEDLEKK